MRRLTLIATSIALFFVTFLTGSHISSAKTIADTTASSYTIYCNGFTASGTSGSPWVHTYAENYDTSTNLINDYASYGSTLNPQIFATSGSGTYSITVTYPTQPEGTSIYFQVYGAATAAYDDYDNAGYVDGYIPCHGILPTGYAATFTDGRLNANDAGQTFALYCKSSTLYVYAIDPVTSAGTLAFTVTPTEIASVPTKPTVNTAIKSGKGATLYRLTSGQLQANRNETTGKVYSYIFNGCP